MGDCKDETELKPSLFCLCFSVFYLSFLIETMKNNMGKNL